MLADSAFQPGTLMVLARNDISCPGRSKLSRSRRAKVIGLLQYGVTLGELSEVVEAGEGWDVMHFSGSRLATQLVMEGVPARTLR